jgi:hypothetical protein
MDCFFNTPTGRKKIKVDMWLDPEAKGNIYCLKFPYFKPMVEYVKTLDRPSSNSFDPASKVWRIKNNRRNLFSLDLITRNEMVKKFIRPLYTEVFEGNWKHQNEMQNAIITRKTCIIGGEMRTGKTKPTLNCIRDLAQGNAWIISTKTALRGVKREADKWGVTKNININYFTYAGFRNYIQELHSSEQAYNAAVLGQGFITSNLIPNFVVFDEMQNLKTPNTRVSDASDILSSWMHELYGWDNYYLVGLSGTPAPKNPGDWWHLLEVICPGYIKEPNRMMFERRLGEFEQQESGIGQMYWRLKQWRQEELTALYKRLKPIVFIFLKKDCLDLPPIEYEIVDLPPTNEMLRTAKLITKNTLNTLSCLNKLRQLSDGFMYQYEYNEEDNTKKRTGAEFTGSPKIEQLKDDLDEYKDIGRIIIYAGFQGSLDIITEECLKKGWVVLQIDSRGWNIFLPLVDKDENDLKGQNFETVIGQKVDIDLCLQEMDRSSDKGVLDKLAIVANPEAGGEGNEFSASPVIIYYSNTNKGAARMQSEARAHSNNMDKMRGLLVKDYCHLPSDYKIRESLINKKDLQAITMGDIQSVFAMVEI